MSADVRLFHPFDTGAINLDEDRTTQCIWRAKPMLEWQRWSGATALQSFKPHAIELERSGLVLSTRPPERLTLAIVQVTRSKTETLGMIAEAWTALRPGGWCIVDGAKTDGIDSIYKTVGARLPVSGYHSKAHGRVFWVQKPEEEPPSVADWKMEADIKEVTPGSYTQAGTFSERGPDEGSVYFLDTIPNDLTGRIADLGAGWGFLSRTLLERGPSITEMHLFEAEAKALTCARLNVTDQRATFHWSDVTREDLGRFDTIIMNPPFHTDRTAKVALGHGFIRAAQRSLERSGSLFMVANRHLPYETVLNECFVDWSEIQSNAKYKIIHATRPRGK